MPRMSKKRKQEWALFLNDRNRITYNELCRKCRNDCKQSFRCIVVLCPKYLSKRRTKKNDWKWNDCQRASWSCQGEWNRAERSEMAMVSIYSGWQGYAVAGRSRRWKKQANAFHCRPALKGRTSALYRNGRKRAYDYHLSDNGRWRRWYGSPSLQFGWWERRKPHLHQGRWKIFVLWG